ncbi:MAG: hypothetical protein M1818_004019 [Claussenomyces sp. TS43310]|nr:MAG: hypothetical protein M1818_004019 [Claussenomyces sp. TS43310]
MLEIVIILKLDTPCSMKLPTPLLTFALALAVTVKASVTDISTDSRTSTVYVQYIGSKAIVPLAQVQYNPSTLDTDLSSYDAPEIPPDTELVRIGIYDEVKKSWTTSTSVTSPETFGKGFAPTIILSFDAQGDVLSVTCKSGRIDAGQTRDFGPKVKVFKVVRGKTPELNKPIVLKEGLPEGEVPEKTLLQRYWWVGILVITLMMATGGEK